MSGPQMTALQVADLAHPTGSKERLIVVLRAYLDASGIDKDQTALAVAGWVASSAKWHQFERDWKAFLKARKLKRWHHSHFHSRKEEYHGWSDAEWQSAYGDLVDILGRFQLFGVGVSLIKQDYEDLRRTGRWMMGSRPYDFCLDECLAFLIHRLHEIPKDEGIVIYNDKDGFDHIGTALANWHTRYLAANEYADDPDRPVSILTGLNTQYVPLQAADVLANETFRYMRSGGSAPALGARPIEGADPHARQLIEDLYGKVALIVRCYNKKALEIELEVWARGEMRLDGRRP